MAGVTATSATVAEASATADASTTASSDKSTIVDAAAATTNTTTADYSSVSRVCLCSTPQTSNAHSNPPPPTQSTTTTTLDFGSCSNPAIKFAPGLDGRDQDSFEPENLGDFNHGSALNIKVITDFICGVSYPPLFRRGKVLMCGGVATGIKMQSLR